LALVCLPVVSNCAAALTVMSCVWLSALYISHRNWNRRFPSPIGKFLKTEMSWLLNPGRVNFALLQLFQRSPRPLGPWKPDVLNHRSTVLWPRGRTALPVCTMPVPHTSPPPEKSKLSVVVKVMFDGWPVANVLIPEISQSSSAHLAGRPGTS